ncbi:MAG TPA: HDOD domain-containing protein [Polyangiaceae bacterium]|nr:HDOD domain-containing protein [Polyangiaceae bacterium]
MSHNSPPSDEAAGHSHADPNAAEMIGKRVGNYVIERPLARGGMGSVFVAKHPHLGREVAVKFLTQEVSAVPELAERFVSEARITANLRHPNIVDILDYGELDGRLYYVMELLRGRNLRSEMKARGRFTPALVALYLEQVCAALDAAHAAGVVHRDLKPGNILVLEGDPPQVKLVDFGVAKVMTTSGPQTRHGQVLGTPTHMAPEQALGDVHRITPLSDLYSLGVIAYEMLTQLPVFQHESEMMLMIMHVRDPVRPIRALVPEVPERFARVIESCLAKDPKGRPQSARVLAEQLRDALRSIEQGSDVEPPPREPSPRLAPQEAGEEKHSRFGSEATVAESVVAPQMPPPAPAPARVGHTLATHAVGSLHATQLAAAPVQRTSLTRGAIDVQAHTLHAAQQVATARSAELAPLPARDEPPSEAASGVVQRVSSHPAEATETPAPEAPTAEEPERTDTPLTATAQTTLNKLQLRLKRKGDFPAFAQTIGEVSKKADAESAYSAGQLSASILKDYALTAKLLRVVNSLYANRFGGKVYSIQHAIVILGFDKVRSLALSIGLFKGAGKNEQSQRISDSAIGSLVSGEIARGLAWNAKLNDEEAMVCAMFRNLGRHLVVVYLPEMYDQIQEIVQRERVTLRAASERVLGVSFGRLGLTVAQSWRLPPRMLSAISAVPSGNGPLTRPEDKLSALSEFANDLCELVASERPGNRERAIGELLGRHKHLLTIDQEAVVKLLAGVREAFQQRYAALFGLDLGASRFLNNVGDLVKAQAEAAEAASLKASSLAETAQDSLPAGTLPEGGFGAEVHSETAAEVKVVVAPLQLGRQLAGPDPLGDRIEQLKALSARLTADEILDRALGIWSQALGVSRLLLLVASPARDELLIRSGIRDDLEALAKELRFPLSNPRVPTGLFSSIYHSGRDTLVVDAFATRSAAAAIPPRYYEVIGSPAFALYGCQAKGSPSAVILVDVESPDLLPAPEQVAPLAQLRPLIAQAAARP